jgi:RHS repeat-associated protein
MRRDSHATLGVCAQTGARSVMLAYEYDVDGRLERRFMQGPTDPQATLEANWQYDLNGKAGTLGAMIGVVDGFRRDYSYDSLLRPSRVSTYVPGNAGYWSARQFNIEYAYDQNYGRIKAMAYPGRDDTATGPATGEIVGFNYSDPRGFMVGESAGGPATVDDPRRYRTVTGMSERGQVKEQSFANGVMESANYDDSTGLALELLTSNLHEPKPAGCNPTLFARQVDYKYDQFLNVASQSKRFLQRDANQQLMWQGCTPAESTSTESYQYDDLQRLTSTTRSWAGMTPTPYPNVNGQSHTYGDSYAYDDLGNILSKADYATNYTYGSSARTVGNAGPHAVSTVTENSVPTVPFSYDLNGNMTSGDGRTVAFDYLDRPVTISMNGVTTQFRYAPDGARYLQYTSGIAASPYPKTVYYVDKSYERVDWSSAVSEEKTYIGSSVVVYKQGGTRDVRYLHMDRLGSLDVVTSSAGAELPSDSHGFDAFGMPRTRDWQWSGAKLHPDSDYQKTTEHGFTGHEHLDETYLIHMNGRIYDYRLGRFLSVDPIISNPASSQSINPYSYIGNNPLSGVDPTGYMPLSFTGLFMVSGDNGATSREHKGPADGTAGSADIGRDDASSPALKFLGGEAPPRRARCAVRPAVSAAAVGRALGDRRVLGTVGVFVPQVKEAISDIQDQHLQAGVATGEAVTGTVLLEAGAGMIGGSGAAVLESDGAAALSAAPALAAGAATSTLGWASIKQSIDTASQVMEMRGNGQGKWEPNKSEEKGAPKEGSAGGPGARKRFSETVKNNAEKEAGGKCVFVARRLQETPVLPSGIRITQFRNQEKVTIPKITRKTHAAAATWRNPTRRPRSS